MASKAPRRAVSVRTAFFVPALILIVTFLAFPVIQTAYLSFVHHPLGSATFGDNPEDAYMGTVEDAGVKLASPDSNFDAGEGPSGSFDVGEDLFIWMRFDLSAIPESASVLSTTLSLYSASHETTGERKRIAVAGAGDTTAANGWIEDRVTWNSYDGLTPWTGGNDGGMGDRGEIFRILSFETMDGDGLYSLPFGDPGDAYVERRLGATITLQVFALEYGHERRFSLSEGPEGQRPSLEVVYEGEDEVLGFRNYRVVITSRDTLNLGNVPWPPMGTLIHNAIWIIIHLPATLFAGLFLAIILRDMRGASFIKGAIFLGMVTPLIVGGMILRFIFTQNAGIFPAFFEMIGTATILIGGRDICLACTWTLQPETLLYGLIFGSVWLWTGFSLIVYSAGLTTIPKEYFEAARIDGASPFRIFWRITWPLMRPITLVVVTMTILYELKIFDIVIAATNASGGVAGAGDVLALQMYRYGFAEFEPNLAAVVATLLTLLTLFATVWTIRYIAGTGATRAAGPGGLRRLVGRLRRRRRDESHG